MADFFTALDWEFLVIFEEYEDRVMRSSISTSSLVKNPNATSPMIAIHARTNASIQGIRVWITSKYYGFDVIEENSEVKKNPAFRRDFGFPIRGKRFGTTRLP